MAAVICVGMAVFFAFQSIYDLFGPHVDKPKHLLEWVIRIVVSIVFYAVILAVIYFGYIALSMLDFEVHFVSSLLDILAGT